MRTLTSDTRPASSLRLQALLALAHASLALYLWFCAYDLSLALTSARLWQILSALWLVWPVLLAVRTSASVARYTRYKWASPSVGRFRSLSFKSRGSRKAVVNMDAT